MSDKASKICINLNQDEHTLQTEVETLKAKLAEYDNNLKNYSTQLDEVILSLTSLFRKPNC